ncbi:MAG: spermidine synthase, partial [Acidobacteria bacterium ACB2]|nr:spermidine synthase [Acidobacteria bacterium ACB2]
MTARTRLLLLACFFVSGGTGLVYEVLWSRHLSLLFGSTTEAVSVVLAVFMTGLGAGAYFLGPRVDRSPSPMRLYALFEAGVGAYALLTGPLLSLVRAAWLGIASRAELSAAAATGVKGLLAALVLLPPAFLMGGTLPALVRAVSEDVAAARRRVALLYALNTLGAVAGVWWGTFWALEHLGMLKTCLIAALANLLIAIVAR